LNGTGQRRYKEAKEIFPGGTQLLSKRPEMFAPDIWPAYYSKAKGCHVWDLDGNKFLDMGIMSVGAAILGYADDDVDNAVCDSIKKGICSSLNCPEEVDIAKVLFELHPWARKARLARCGGEAMMVAVRIARAYTEREIVLFSGYHGWGDWYLSANFGDNDALDGQLMPGLSPTGIPRGLKGTALPFDLNNLAKMKDDVRSIESKIAAIVIEPARGEEASKAHLEDLKEYCEKIGAVLIFDEITSGFRMNAGGIHLKYNIFPDIAIFAKSMANGYGMAAIIGKSDVMEASQKTFISSTNWTERVGPTAAIATIKKYISKKVDTHIIKQGERVKNIWSEKAKKYGLNVHVSGIPTLCHFSFGGEYSSAGATVFTVEMLKRKVLGFRQFKPSYAHLDEHINEYEDAVDEVFKIMSKTSPTEFSFQMAHKGFHRLTKE
jgi:glutamate-1-semialdehyde aminotransferase